LLRRAERGSDPGLFSFVCLAPTAMSDIVSVWSAQVFSLILQICQAERRFLPFARRALMIDRPARVDMRARKPCLRARLRRLGWKVRFIVLSFKFCSVSVGPADSLYCQISDKRGEF
jgi:hypothetical protein